MVPTIAERAAAERGLRVLVLDRRSHIGGNAYSATDPSTGIEIHRYGPHLFHTPNVEVWDYLNRFTAFTDFQYRGIAAYGGAVLPFPINLGTICQFFGRHMSPSEAAPWLPRRRTRRWRASRETSRKGYLADRPAAL